MRRAAASLSDLLFCWSLIACGGEEEVAGTAPLGETNAASNTSWGSATDSSVSTSAEASTNAPTAESTETGEDMREETGVDDRLGFDAHVWPIFDAQCSCHKSPTPSGGLDLRADNAYASLVDTPSIQDPDTLRVAPGDPEDSYLVWKITGMQPVGGTMPPGTPLSPVEIDTIEQWIADGAAP